MSKVYCIRNRHGEWLKRDRNPSWGSEEERHTWDNKKKAKSRLNEIIHNLHYYLERYGDNPSYASLRRNKIEKLNSLLGCEIIEFDLVKSQSLGDNSFSKQALNKLFEVVDPVEIIRWKNEKLN